MPFGLPAVRHPVQLRAGSGAQISQRRLLLRGVLHQLRDLRRPGLSHPGGKVPLQRGPRPPVAGGHRRVLLPCVPHRQRLQHPQKRGGAVLGVHPAGGAGAHWGVHPLVRGAPHAGAGPGGGPGGGRRPGDERPAGEGPAEGRPQGGVPGAPAADFGAQRRHGQHVQDLHPAGPPGGRRPVRAVHLPLRRPFHFGTAFQRAAALFQAGPALRCPTFSPPGCFWRP